MKTVTCNGCFDGLHPGHLFYLGYCAAHGDRLIVGINDDDYLRRHKREPFHPSWERRDMLLRLGCVEQVRIFGDDDPREFLRQVRPDVHCTGREYGTECIESSVCEELGIQLVLIPRLRHWSTSRLPGAFRTMMADMLQGA